MSQKTLKPELANLYETDYLAWVELTLTKLRSRDLTAIDWDNIIEEIADMGKSTRSSLKSNLRTVLQHLLKWQYQPSHRSRSWQSSIIEHRLRIADAFTESPSLKRYFAEIFDDAYAGAIQLASSETGISKKTFPNTCPYTQEQVLDPDFLPN
ncbi:DUF29 domain-containing protein [Pseudanabaena sp. Chao 1811]|uniref:DUF29 domain-containing protein n=1 Tax=Pseudanabaena sp. Chao 1811 TaxID=2963092 RepID=UPI0022F38EFD|nr:DUF29 domain-containing protein [Pseudanabaena sp. Chao 1811]